MKISSRLIGLSVCTVVVVTGLSVTLAGELRSVSLGYNTLLQGPVRDAETARKIQVGFKKEVQEWKDILLRGHNPDDLTKYTRQFHAQQVEVETEAQTLARTVENPATKRLVDAFLTAHEALSKQYQTGYEVYVNGKFDFKAADKLVRGLDRPPTDLFDQVVMQLNTQVADGVAAQQADSIRRRNTSLIVASALLFLIAVVGFTVVRGVLTRLGQLKLVSDRLAKGDMQGLSIDTTGSDEIGEFGQSLKGGAAAFRELLAMASA